MRLNGKILQDKAPIFHALSHRESTNIIVKIRHILRLSSLTASI